MILSLATLAGCGFAPIHGPGGPARSLRGRIAVLAPADEEGSALVRRLEDRLGTPQEADLVLAAKIRIGETAVGFLSGGEISRFNVEGQVDWQLADSTGAAVLTGRERGFTSYAATSTTVATTSARRDARRRLMVILADHIATNILTHGS
ncbi:MAG: LPS assembly lipoprotein LptE [Boseongicola sp.]|nr:LPS assembly lipoprotein LptE [Boseongicola sp.]